MQGKARVFVYLYIDLLKLWITFCPWFVLWIQFIKDLYYNIYNRRKLFPTRQYRFGTRLKTFSQAYHLSCRLFNIQMSGLIALFRLFVGRKRNPLRARIDSCEYCSEQLFVGTVAFSALLLLLPTTTMYYTVFTMVSI